MTAIILDMDNVVVLSERLHLKTLDVIFRQFGIRYSRKEHATRLAGTGAENIIRTVLAEHGMKANVKALVKKRTSLYQRIIEKKNSGLRTTPGLASFLRALKTYGIPVAVASGGHRRNVIGSLKAVDVDPKIFKAIITVEDVPQRKPHPHLFLATARALHARPNECIVFEDSIAGIEAAKRARMRCVGLITTTTRKNLQAAGADLVVKDFRDKKLRQWLGL